MSNMSYCRFQNTVADVRDCWDNIHDSLSGAEFDARNKLIELCKRIAEFDTDDFSEQCPDCRASLANCDCDE